jgi:hypothetical protein
VGEEKGVAPLVVIREARVIIVAVQILCLAKKYWSNILNIPP